VLSEVIAISLQALEVIKVFLADQHSFLAYFNTIMEGKFIYSNYINIFALTCVFTQSMKNFDTISVLATSNR